MDYNSHLLLSEYLSCGKLDAVDRRFFIIGNVLPDMLVGTFFKKHSFNSRKKEILQILTKLKNKKRTPFFYLKLGYCMHFIADFFTSPHNISPRVKLSTHLAYEKQLYYVLKRFIKENNTHIAFTDFISLYLKYIKQPFSVENDCKYILCATKGIFNSFVNS